MLLVVFPEHREHTPPQEVAIPKHEWWRVSVIIWAKLSMGWGCPGHAHALKPDDHFAVTKRMR